jgi:glycosyltransferase involved in cell wall biosynthesis
MFPNNSVGERDITRFLFAGAISKWTGIFELAEFWHDVIEPLHPHAVLEIYGKGDVRQLSQLLRKCKRVKFNGFVSHEKLIQALIDCHAFINARPTQISGGEHNFPSKLFDYLRYSKPIISSLTLGLAPEYREVLLVYANRHELLGRISQVVNMNEENYRRCCLQHYDFAKSNTWRERTSRFLDWSFRQSQKNAAQ